MSEPQTKQVCHLADKDSSDRFWTPSETPSSLEISLQSPRDSASTPYRARVLFADKPKKANRGITRPAREARRTDGARAVAQKTDIQEKIPVIS